MAEQLGAELTVWASRQESLGVLEANRDGISWLRDLGPVKTLFPGLEWQPGLLSIPIECGDILVVSGAPRSISTLVLMGKAKLRGARIVWWGHYWSSTSKYWRASIRYALMHLADVILFYTDQEVDDYRKRHLGAACKPARALNNGIDTRDICRFRSPFVAATRTRDLLFIGRLTEKAELALLLRALASQKCAAMTLDIIGDGERMEELHRLAVELNLEGRIIWHGGTADEARIASIANRCKAFVYPGSVGLSLIHGLAYGLPAVVHNDRWNHMPEFAALSVGLNGFTFERGNAESLAKTLVALLSDVVALDVASAHSIATIERTFNIDDMASRFTRVIEEL